MSTPKMSGDPGGRGDQRGRVRADRLSLSKQERRARREFRKLTKGKDVRAFRSKP